MMLNYDAEIGKLSFDCRREILSAKYYIEGLFSKKKSLIERNKNQAIQDALGYSLNLAEPALIKIEANYTDRVETCIDIAYALIRLNYQVETKLEKNGLFSRKKLYRLRIYSDVYQAERSLAYFNLLADNYLEYSLDNWQNYEYLPILSSLKENYQWTDVDLSAIRLRVSNRELELAGQKLNLRSVLKIVEI